MLLRPLAFLLASACFAGGAFAADLPTHKSPPPPAPIIPPFTWTGFYVGGQGGFSWDGEEIFTKTWSHGLERSGPVAGLTAGYNYQVNNFVLGAEAEYNLSSITGSISPLPTYSLSTKVNSFGSLDGLVGFTPFDRLLFFGVGGLAGADIQHSIVLTGIEQDDFRKFEVGWDWGGGVAYAITNQLAINAQYRHYNFGRTDFASVGLLGPHSTRETLSSVLVGLTYTFGH